MTERLVARVPGLRGRSGRKSTGAGLSYTVDTVATMAAAHPLRSWCCCWARTPSPCSSSGGSRNGSGRWRGSPCSTRGADAPIGRRRSRPGAGACRRGAWTSRPPSCAPGWPTGAPFAVSCRMPSRTTSRSIGCIDKGTACSSAYSRPSSARATSGTASGSSRSSTPSTSTRRGSPALSDEELQAQTAKFRAILHERTRRARGDAPRSCASRSAPRPTPPSASGIDTELTGADGTGGVERDLRARHRRDARRDPPRGVRHGARGLPAGSSARRSTSPGATSSGTWCRTTSSSWAASSSTSARSPRWRRAKARRSSPRCRSTSTRCPGKGAHLVTVNSYLARRDSQWMGHLYRWLGLTVGCLDDTEAGTPERRAAYHGRHHLRHEQRVRLRLPARQHGRRRSTSACSAAHVFAIVDEVDSVLIDEARTPLIISGPGRQRGRRPVLRAQRRRRRASCGSRWSW